MAKKPVLIVDDAPDIRRTLSMVFSMKGVPVVEAADGREALAALARGADPSLILLDWMMPEINGRGVLEALAANAVHADLPVYVLSAMDRQPDLAGVRVNGWLKKPVALADVMALARLHCE